MQKEISFETEKGQVIDITDQIEELIEKGAGIASIFAPHATGILIIGENEPRIAEDYKRLMESIAPEGGGWKHDSIDSNAHAHLRSALFGTSLTIPFTDGKLILGTWQRIMFIECDGSRRRKLVVTLVPIK